VIRVKPVRAGKDSRTPKEPDFRETNHLNQVVLFWLFWSAVMIYRSAFFPCHPRETSQSGKGFPHSKRARLQGDQSPQPGCFVLAFLECGNDLPFGLFPLSSQRNQSERERIPALQKSQTSGSQDNSDRLFWLFWSAVMIYRSAFFPCHPRETSQSGKGFPHSKRARLQGAKRTQTGCSGFLGVR